MSTTTNPLKWLLAELPAYIEPRDLDRLMEEYDAQEAAYARSIKIRKAERTIKTLEWRNKASDLPTLNRWREKLDRLKAGDL